MIDLIAKTFIEKDDEAIMADITFPRYAATTNMMGGVPVIVPLKNYTHDLTGMLKAITPKTKLYGYAIQIIRPNYMLRRRGNRFLKQSTSKCSSCL